MYPGGREEGGGVGGWGLMEGKINFSLEQFVNKTVLFDISKVSEDKK